MSSVSSLVLFDTHPPTKTVGRHFLEEEKTMLAPLCVPTTFDLVCIYTELPSHAVRELEIACNSSKIFSVAPATKKQTENPILTIYLWIK